MKIDDLSILHLLCPLLQLLIGGGRRLIFAFGSQKMTAYYIYPMFRNTILSNLVESRVSSLISCKKQTSFQNDDKNVLGKKCYRTVPNGCQNQLQHLGFIDDLAFLTYRL
jgi:hypothetical protein